ncbi:hypothetical protein O181_046753 [Austropuccinia psidii MF-1]|uniref:Uncharacterized protein n=1 Tax=Austropuccinia psidii MF-1 TaxID=1389203 RepID=A0A9Q3HIV2_9BASI|nr:hypothetical protein [Austropuccinia psidii MF-1]
MTDFYNLNNLKNLNINPNPNSTSTSSNPIDDQNLLNSNISLIHPSIKTSLSFSSTNSNHPSNHLQNLINNQHHFNSKPNSNSIHPNLKSQITPYGISLEHYRFGQNNQSNPINHLSNSNSNHPSNSINPFENSNPSNLTNHHSYPPSASSNLHDSAQLIEKNHIDSSNSYNHQTSTWPSSSLSTHSSLRSNSIQSDRDKYAPDFVRILSSDVNPYAPSIISSSDSNSHYRSSSGSFASSLRCPLLESHDSRRRHSDAGSILAMHPLPVMISNPQKGSSSFNYFNNSPHTPRVGPPISDFSINGSNNISSPSTYNSIPGGNLFVPLRRRFLPHLDGRLSFNKPRIETQLLGELLLALEEYVTAFGRRVKVSPSHQFGINGTSAAVVVAVAVTASGAVQSSNPSASDLAASDLIRAALDTQDDQDHDEDDHDGDDDDLDEDLDEDNDQADVNLQSDLSLNHHPTISQSSLNHQSRPSSQSSNRKKIGSKSKGKIDIRVLAELCEELENVTTEVVDVVPAFGEKLMQGHYGPLAVRARSSSSIKSFQQSSTHTQTNFQPDISLSSLSKPLTALERFSDYEPGGAKDTSDGGSRWWAERLLRDLLEGIFSETVVKSASVTNLLTVGSSPQRFASPTLTMPLISQRVEIFKDKNWSTVSSNESLEQSHSWGSLKRKGRINKIKRPGSIVREELEEESAEEDREIRESGRISAGPIEKDSKSTRDLIAEASQDLIIKKDWVGNRLQVKCSNTGLTNKEDRLKQHDLKQIDNGVLDEHRKELLDQGRKRWLAFKANQNEFISRGKF